jgi:hypothetical protein
MNFHSQPEENVSIFSHKDKPKSLSDGGRIIDLTIENIRIGQTNLVYGALIAIFIREFHI